jgi:hypothetical protein
VIRPLTFLRLLYYGSAGLLDAAICSMGIHGEHRSGFCPFCGDQL